MSYGTSGRRYSQSPSTTSVTEKNEKNEKNEKRNDDCLFHITIATNVTIMSLDCLDTCERPIPPRPLRYPHALKSLQIACHA